VISTTKQNMNKNPIRTQRLLIPMAAFSRHDLSSEMFETGRYAGTVSDGSTGDSTASRNGPLVAVNIATFNRTRRTHLTVKFQDKAGKTETFRASLATRSEGTWLYPTTREEGWWHKGEAQAGIGNVQRLQKRSEFMCDVSQTLLASLPYWRSATSTTFYQNTLRHIPKAATILR
jgi:hypothetical protein